MSNMSEENKNIEKVDKDFQGEVFKIEEGEE